MFILDASTRTLFRVVTRFSLEKFPLLLIITNASKCILLTILCPQDSFKNNSKIQQQIKMLLCLRNWEFSGQLGSFFLQDKEVIFKG